MNKKKSKKKIILLTSFIASIALVFVIVIACMFSGNKATEDQYSIDIRIMNEHNASLVIYGDEVSFRNEVKYKNITEINESFFTFDGNEFFVINDRSSNASLDDEDYIEIKDLISNGVTFMYIAGTSGSKLDIFKEKGFINDKFPKDKLGFVISARNFKVGTGLWSYDAEEAYKINDELLGSSIVGSIARELQR